MRTDTDPLRPLPASRRGAGRFPSLHLALAVLGLILVAVPVAADSTDSLRTLRVQLSADGADSLRLDVPVGEVEVEGNDGRQVEVQVRLECSKPVKERCRQMVQKVEISSANRDSRLEVELDGWPDNLKNSGLSADVHVAMPRDLALIADLGVGEFEAVGLIADLSLDIGVGEASIRTREASVGRVDLEVGVGDARLRVRDRNVEGSGFIGRELAWRDGPGQASVKVDCGVGEVDVRLDD